MVKFDGMRISFGLFDAAALSRLRPKVVMVLDRMLADITRAIDAIHTECHKNGGIFHKVGMNKVLSSQSQQSQQKTTRGSSAPIPLSRSMWGDN
jgi:hypothetical protein